MKSLYLLLDLGAISVPFIASFYPKAPFYKTWKAATIAILIPALIFISWDIAFTEMNIWGFNNSYLTGITMVNLPLEEWLFFICIPYACLFTYFSTKFLIKRAIFGRAQIFGWLLASSLLIIGLVNYDKLYTSVTFIALALFLIGHLTIIKSTYLGRFFLAFVFILIPFFIINGILTGSGIEGQVVWYNDLENLGVRMGTIPVEDTFYGMLLILMNVTIYEWLLNSKKGA